MKNKTRKERVVEEITRELLKQNKDYYPDSEQFHLDSGKIPEFVIANGGFDMVIECKAYKSKIKDAINEVKEYALEIAKNKNVIAIAVAGADDTTFKSYYLKKGETDFKLLKTDTLLSFDDYKEQVEILEKADELNEDTLKSKADELNNLIRTHADVGIQLRSTLIAAILIAVENKAFRESYEEEENGDLPKEIYDTIEKILRKEKNFPNIKKEAILSEFKFLESDINLSKEKIIGGKKTTPIKFFTDYIVKKVYLKLKSKSEVDLLAEFYTEFFKRTSLSGKELGIVLTPDHVKKFMARLVNINKQDTVLDTSTGTGGFLIRAMNIMVNQADTNEEKDRIKSNQLIGVELKANMFLMAYASMKFHGDGKSNLYLGDSLDENIVAQYRDRANKALINPPYSLGKKDKNLDEWNFVLTTLNALRSHGKLAVIIPVSKFIGKASNQWKEDIMAKHTLEAVISMPDQLFYPTGTVTAIGIFTAHVPHDKDIETVFVSLKDDGHEITRTNGREDQGQWETIEADVLRAVMNKKEISGQSVCKTVKAEDEWIAEAYLTPDYSELKEEDFINNIKQLYSYEYLKDV